MSDCCGDMTGGALDASGDACPCCGMKGAKVDPITLKALLTGEGLRRGIPPVPRFCATKSCQVVYFDNALPVRFEEGLVTVRVHAKHVEDGRVPVCYCFGYTPEAIRTVVASSGRNAVSEDVAREVKAGRCACEVKNPKGSCCLGDVSSVENALVEATAATREGE
jgi:Zinc binding domain